MLLMCGLLLRIEHHLLVCPLSELCVGVEISPLLGHWTLLCWMSGVHGERLLVSILVEGGGVEGLSLSVPVRRLLLDRIRILLLGMAI